MKDLDILITKNGRYIMIENMIYDKVLDRHGDINDASFSDLIDIISENVAFLVQDIKTNLTEISSFTRKNAYHVLECFGETDKRLSLMMEYEVKFGSSLLTESVTNPKLIMIETWSWIKEQVLVLEQTYNQFNKDFWSTSNAKQIGSNVKQIGSKAVSGAKSLAKSAMDTSKSIGMSVGNFVVNPGESLKKAWNWVKENGISGVMESVREFLYSGVGTAAQIFVSLIPGAGQIATAILWGVFLIYDLYQGFANGIEIDFANNVYHFGDFSNVTNGTYIQIENAAQQIKTYGGNEQGLYLDFSSRQFKLGDYMNNQNNYWLEINDSAELFALNGNLLLSSSASGNSGQHLVLTINGTQYKIKLENP
jgi:hypothetical protein